MKKTPYPKKNLFRFSVLILTILLLTVSFAGTVSAADDKTSVIVFTDWHAHTDQSQSMIDMVSAEASEHKYVIVCFNGDSENAQSTDDYGDSVVLSSSKWRKDHSYVTPFMILADEMLKNENVQIVMGLGNHELGINEIGAKDSEQLAAYITTLKNREGNRFHIVSTDLMWKSDGAMAQLYGGIITRSVELHGITFISVVSPKILKNEFGKKYDKGGLYENIKITYTLTAKVSEVTDNLGSDALCVLLAHAGKDDISGSLKYMGLPTDTYVLTGHDHRSPFKSFNDHRMIIQADKYGKGAAVFYVDNSGHWIDDAELKPIQASPSNELITQDKYVSISDYMKYSSEAEA